MGSALGLVLVNIFSDLKDGNGYLGTSQVPPRWVDDNFRGQVQDSE